MKNLYKIKLILRRLKELLYFSNDYEWAVEFNRLEHEYIAQPNEVIQSVLSLYGGMGSFNDLILYKNGNVLGEENREFSLLRAKLFDLCIAYKSSNIKEKT